MIYTRIILCIDVACDSHNNDILHIMNVYNRIKNVLYCVYDDFCIGVCGDFALYLRLLNFPYH